MAELSVRHGLCLGCDNAIEQLEREKGVWRPLLCPTCFAEQAAVSPFLASLPVTQRAIAAVQFTLASLGFSVPAVGCKAAIRAACLADVHALGAPLPAATVLQHASLPAPNIVPAHCTWCRSPGHAPITVLAVQAGVNVRVYDIPEDLAQPGDISGACPNCHRPKYVRVLRSAA
jgi:hypothetical protein